MNQLVGGIPESILELGDGGFNLFFRSDSGRHYEWLVVKVPPHHRKRVDEISAVFRNEGAELELRKRMRGFTTYRETLSDLGLPPDIDLLFVDKEGELLEGVFAAEPGPESSGDEVAPVSSVSVNSGPSTGVGQPDAE